MFNAITRDGAMWIQRAPGAEHYSERWDNGHLLLHANRHCCPLQDPVVVPPKTVQTLWDKDAAASTANETDVQWCQSCAMKRVED